MIFTAFCASGSHDTSTESSCILYRETEDHAKMTYPRFDPLKRGPGSMQPSRNARLELLRHLLCN